VSVGRARAVLSTVWIVLGLPLIGVVFLQTIKGKYGQNDWDTGFSWLIPLLFPTLSLIIATWTVAETPKDRIIMTNKHVFYLSLTVSIFYLGMLYSVIGFMPPTLSEFETYVANIMRRSSWYLGTVQAIVVVLVGKFFLEHIPEENQSERASTNTQSPGK
jgi:hypothetical protein